MLPKWPWAPDSQLGHKCPQKNSCFFFTFYGLATHLFHSLFSLLALCSLLYCVLLCVCVSVCVRNLVCICIPSVFCLLHTHSHMYTHSHVHSLPPSASPTPPRPRNTSIQQPEQAEIPKIPLFPEAVRHPPLNSSFTASPFSRASSHHRQLEEAGIS